MKSHTCDFKGSDLGALVGWPLVLPVLFAAVMHLGAAWRLLPAPRPILDIDRTILIHQAEASRLQIGADVVFVGDSSCLMDFSAKDLEGWLPPNHRVLNLATLSYMDLPACAGLLRNYVTANPDRLRVVVLLLHPEMLRGIEPVPQYLAWLQQFYDGADACDSDTVSARFSCLLGFNILKGRLLSRVLPVPLAKSYGRFYGFTTDLHRFLTAQQGSAVDPHQFVSQPGLGNAEYRLSAKMEAAGGTFKSALPPGAQLIVGITPSPQSFVTADYPVRHRAMLADWSQCLPADAVLADLPATLPDRFFASTTHLNEAGAQLYTRILTRSLSRHLR